MIKDLYSIDQEFPYKKDCEACYRKYQRECIVDTLNNFTSEKFVGMEGPVGFGKSSYAVCVGNCFKGKVTYFTPMQQLQNQIDEENWKDVCIVKGKSGYMCNHINEKYGLTDIRCSYEDDAYEHCSNSIPDESHSTIPLLFTREYTEECVARNLSKKNINKQTETAFKSIEHFNSIYSKLINELDEWYKISVDKGVVKKIPANPEIEDKISRKILCEFGGCECPKKSSKAVSMVTKTRVLTPDVFFYLIKNPYSHFYEQDLMIFDECHQMDEVARRIFDSEVRVDTLCEIFGIDLKYIYEEKSIIKSLGLLRDFCYNDGKKIIQSAKILAKMANGLHYNPSTVEYLKAPNFIFYDMFKMLKCYESDDDLHSEYNENPFNIIDEFLYHHFKMQNNEYPYQPTKEFCKITEDIYEKIIKILSNDNNDPFEIYPEIIPVIDYIRNRLCNSYDNGINIIDIYKEKASHDVVKLCNRKKLCDDCEEYGFFKCLSYEECVFSENDYRFKKCSRSKDIFEGKYKCENAFIVTREEGCPIYSGGSCIKIKVSNWYIIIAYLKKLISVLGKFIEEFNQLNTSFIKAGKGDEITKSFYVGKILPDKERYDDYQENIEGKKEKVLTLTIINIGAMLNFVYYNKCKHVLFMSGTWIYPDIQKEMLGVKDMKLLTVGSSFPLKNRPTFIVRDRSFLNMSEKNSYGQYIYKTTEGSKEFAASFELLVKKIKLFLSDTHGINTNIVVHCHTFDIAKIIGTYSNDIFNDLVIHCNVQIRNVFHKKYVKVMDKDRLMSYVKSNHNSGIIIVSPSLTQGVDFKYNLAHAQIIVKHPIPYMGDPYISIMCNGNEELGIPRNKNYIDKVVYQTLSQMYGRIVRAENDYGYTFITDQKSVESIYKYLSTFNIDLRKELNAEFFLKSVIHKEVTGSLPLFYTPFKLK